MEMPPAWVRELSRQLLAMEAADDNAGKPRAHEGVRVCEKLRIAVTRFAGAEAFASLMRRALALARTDAPSVQGMTVNADGSVDGLEALAAARSRAGAAEDCGALVADSASAIVTHLLWLLITFVGEPVTIKLVQHGWPASSMQEQRRRIKPS